MRGLLIGFSLVLSSCGGNEVSAEEQARIDAAKIAAVERAAILPAVPILPQAITFADVEKNDLFGAGCNFMATGSKDILALALDDRAVLKLDGKFVRLAPDRGSPVGPLGSQSKYDGMAHSLKLEIDQSTGQQSGIETVDFPARMEVRNERDQIVFTSDGVVQCGS